MKEIGAAMGIDQRTASNHKTAILRKLRLTCDYGLIKFARDCGFIKDGENTSKIFTKLTEATPITQGRGWKEEMPPPKRCRNR